MREYFNPADLKKFNPENMSRAGGTEAAKFFEYYGAAMKGGALSEREKALIALAIAHFARCPYCIDAYSQTCLQVGADEKQMTEAVHVAAAMSAGITLVASLQMQNRIDDLQM